MCGLAGYAGKEQPKDALRRMANAIRRRGPDDEGFYESEGVGFAFRRLSIIDLTGGHQPLSNEDGTVQVMLNGEIYHFQEIRGELEKAGHRFATKSDTEVIAHAYEQWGDECFERIDGMFAIAIWDAKQSRLVLARDRLGKKPLYWTLQGGTVWFASELKALLAAGVVKRDLDPVAVAAYFRSDAVPTPRSIFKDAAKLEPGSLKSWKIQPRGGGATAESSRVFWQCPAASSGEPTADAAISGLRAVVDRAVRHRLIADVPLGVFLSGGLDSAVVAESAARMASHRLSSFTIGYEEASYDERDPARRMAERLGFDHHEMRLGPDAALGMLEEAIEVLDEPLADPAILPQLALSRFTRERVTVALTGDGGDELLLGYPHVKAHEWFRRFQATPSAIRRLSSAILSRVPSGSGYFSAGFKTQRLARGLNETDAWRRELAWRGSFLSRDLKEILSQEGMRSSTQEADEIFRRYASEANGDFWKAWTWAMLRTYLMDVVLVKVDRASMWYGLEARSPLLDSSVVTYLLNLPDHFKLKPFNGKRLFVELVRGRIPDDLLARPKHGFGVPTARWLNGALAPRLAEVADSAFLKRQGIFEPDVIQRLIAQHANGRPDRRKELWAFLSFQLWYHRWAI